MWTIRKPRWQTEGSEPDYRFSLANERTFLAWIRTALAVLAAAVVLHQLAPQARPGDFVHAAKILLAALGATIAGGAYMRWKSHEIAMRHGRPLNSGIGLAVIVVAVCLLGAGFGVYVLAFG